MARRAQPLTEVVTDALRAHPNVTVDELSSAVGVGRSSVAKALVELEGAATAVRAPGGRDGGRRLPDLWSPVLVDSPLTDSAPKAEAVEHDDPTDAPKRVADKAPSDRERLGKGALGSLVFAHLAASPEEEHGAVAVAKALGGRSSGAVGNALQRLCDQGRAVLTSASPRRYRFAEGAPSTDKPDTDKASAAEPSDGKRAPKGNGRGRAATGAAGARRVRTKVGAK